MTCEIEGCHAESWHGYEYKSLCSKHYIEARIKNTGHCYCTCRHCLAAKKKMRIKENE